MSEFILDYGTPDAEARVKACSPFVRGYIEAMFFTDTGTGDDAENNLEHANVHELSASAWERITRDCENFQSYAKAWLIHAYEADDYSEEQAGRDFWYTRNGHGVGFWDRPQLEHTAWHRKDSLGNALSEMCERYGDATLYRGDDGHLYHE
jgi:hypothetical protein